MDPGEASSLALRNALEDHIRGPVVAVLFQERKVVDVRILLECPLLSTLESIYQDTGLIPQGTNWYRRGNLFQPLDERDLQILVYPVELPKTDSESLTAEEQANLLQIVQNPPPPTEGLIRALRRRLRKTPSPQWIVDECLPKEAKLPLGRITLVVREQHALPKGTFQISVQGLLRYESLVQANSIRDALSGAEMVFDSYLSTITTAWGKR